MVFESMTDVFLILACMYFYKKKKHIWWITGAALLVSDVVLKFI